MVVKALRALNVKVVVTPDIDILDNESTFKALCEEIGIEWDSVAGKWKSVFEYVKNQRAQLDTAEARKEIYAIFDGIKTPQMTKDDIEAVKKKLKASSAWAKVKETGKAFFSGGSYSDFTDMDKVCKKNGLFIVPVGELESFYKPAANKHGTAWVDIVMGKDLAHDTELEAARKFVKELAEF